MAGHGVLQQSRSEALLPKFGWYLENAGRQTHPVGRLKPNDLGLFDVLGNAYEWTQDRFVFYRVGQNDELLICKEMDGQISDNFIRTSRGGTFGIPAMGLRSAFR